jgi:hypothetical protein
VGESQVSHSISGFFQDDWKISRRLTLNLGLRYDFQSQAVERNNGATNFDPFCKLPNGLPGCTVFAGLDGQPRNWRNEDYKNLGPRIGFAFDVLGNARTVIRGGYAIIYPSQMWRENYPNANGFAQTSTSYPQADANRPAFLLRQGFPSAPVPPQGRALGAAAFLGQTVAYDETDGNIPRSQQFSLSLQQQLAGSWLVEASYSGNLGRGFTAGSYDMNQLDPQYLSLGQGLQQQVPNPYAGMVPGALGNPTITREQSLKPFPYYSAINVRNPRLGSYTSHLFLSSVEKRMSHGLTMLFSYTAARSLATVWHAGQFRSDRAGLDRRLSEWQVQPACRAIPRSHRCLATRHGQHSLRASLRARSTWLGAFDWRLAGQYDRHHADRDSAQCDRSQQPARHSARLHRVAAKLDNGTAQRWFDTTQFVNPAPFTFGNVGRVLPNVRTPGTVNWTCPSSRTRASSSAPICSFASRCSTS